MQSTPTKPQEASSSERAQLVIWHLTDSALPTGGFAHSAGMETYIQSGAIDDADTFAEWLKGYLYQATFNDALAVRFAVELHNSTIGWDEKVARLNQLDRLLHATLTPKELRAAMQSMGKRMSKVARIVDADDMLVEEYDRGLRAREYKGNPGIALGLVLAAAGVDEYTAAKAYLMQLATSMVQNAIRAIPLGQDAGQRLLVGVYGLVTEFAQQAMEHTVHDLGVAAPDMEIAQMEHEFLRSRMFMS
ncbi:urease accessory protein UreF [Corynebacterium glucuronolyticum]|uniref:urease accessory protein UreF n=1 Tax=Corynebacterium glucuronolyticum TaxID=39791 RepID=UPI00019C2178|nr:urease accessory UreF family protein [Corynebacterium glucuronolyticum]EEI27380.1 urease accessory protein UreF [Corynebacterium glucuronolyticum ATCC 51867]MCT1441656.1 urease accessory protein UreF [Corynebacterium glucuronolyticum]QRO83475.1 urease accessory protein UreF [Corynebacterium glucuronolyticum]